MLYKFTYLLTSLFVVFITASIVTVVVVVVVVVQPDNWQVVRFHSLWSRICCFSWL